MKNKGLIYQEISRPPKRLIEGLKELGVAIVHEVMTDDMLMDPLIKPVISGQTVAGPALTSLNCPGDNLAMHVSLSLAQEGDVLVTTFLGDQYNNAVWGELTTTSAIARNIAAVVADGAVRDVNAIRELKFPLWGRIVFPRRSAKSNLAGVNIPVTCGDINVNPGDIIIADDDGIVVVPQAEAEDVLIRGKEKQTTEDSMKESLSEGKTPFEILNMNKILEKQGCKIINGKYNTNKAH